MDDDPRRRTGPLSSDELAELAFETGKCPDPDCPLNGGFPFPFPAPGDWHALQYHYPLGKQ